MYLLPSPALQACMHFNVQIPGLSFKVRPGFTVSVSTLFIYITNVTNIMLRIVTIILFILVTKFI